MSTSRKLDHWVRTGLPAAAVTRANSPTEGREGAETPASGREGGSGPQRGTQTPRPKRRCPNGSVLMIEGEWFPCDQMDAVAPTRATHEGLPHSNEKAGAIWRDAS